MRSMSAKEDSGKDQVPMLNISDESHQLEKKEVVKQIGFERRNHGRLRNFSNFKNFDEAKQGEDLL